MKKAIIFIGTPGVGKSTLLNTCIGKPVFPSGVSFIAGMTRKSAFYSEDGITYIDTPGLDNDNERKAVAIREIEEALNRHRVVTVVFVFTLESGRLKPADMTTMKFILDSITQAGVDVEERYSIIINMVSEKLLYKLETDVPSSNRTRQVFGSHGYLQLFGIKSPHDTLIVPVDDEALDEDNVTVSSVADLRSFCFSAPSFILERSVRLKELEFQDIRDSISRRSGIFKSIFRR